MAPATSFISINYINKDRLNIHKKARLYVKTAGLFVYTYLVFYIHCVIKGSSSST